MMAVCIVELLRERGTMDQDCLAAAFQRRFAAETERGYGAVAYWLLHQLAREPWREVSAGLFGGQGSLGNGSAMRVAPLGAFFHHDLDRVMEEARASAEVTHMHPEGIAGAQAVALATALLVRRGALESECPKEKPSELLGAVAERLPRGVIRAGVERAREVLGAPPHEAAEALGDGREVRCSDTVPFALCCAAQHPADFEAALWFALGGLLAPESDRDTVLAIVGGIVGAVAPPPGAWLEAREPLPA